MQFQHPEVLYALFLLLIPIFIHLFQLRRFQKVAFTNVAFLKKATLQTRKSSQLKKWLVLCTRLLALTCLIVAFAQPFSTNEADTGKPQEVVLYLDNSHSMQARGSNGPLLERSLQELYDADLDGETISYFTNDKEYRDLSLNDFKRQILLTPYSNSQLSAATVLRKAEQWFSNNAGTDKKLLYISDFQSPAAWPEVPNDISILASEVRPVNPSNISIDSLRVVSRNADAMDLEVWVTAQGVAEREIPVSLFRADVLAAKSSVRFEASGQQKVAFSLENPSAFRGRIEVNDTEVPFDNQFYFNTNASEAIKVMTINGEDATFLQRLFQQEEFDYVQQSLESLNYDAISSQHFIVLNQLETIPNALQNALNAFMENGGSLLIIPSETADTNSYNALLSRFGLGSLGEETTTEKQVTNISFAHPLYADVFEKEITNFQYPKVQSYYKVQSAATPVLRFEDRQPFLLQQGTAYLLTAALTERNSNFTNSPLIVPTLYNMAQRSLPLPTLSYTIGKTNSFAVPVQLMQDEIVALQDSTLRFIPQQQTKANTVLVTTTEQPSKQGTFQVTKEQEVLQRVSFNYDRAESSLRYGNATDWDGVEVFDSVSDLLGELAEANEKNQYWKWFAIFALLFLLLEMLILKFYK
ncbi:MAG: hypothetical protein CMC35_01865 [Flavobacteriaceae bacterium]|nr:hypothetical protein [Flavobacteriaceae bacterium]|tara:strand:+ start:19712 stop:21634 length:1923 start_codon:yes stop_codon:yes gene_type:complete